MKLFLDKCSLEASYLHSSSPGTSATYKHETINLNDKTQHTLEYLTNSSLKVQVNFNGDFTREKILSWHKGFKPRPSDECLHAIPSLQEMELFFIIALVLPVPGGGGGVSNSPLLSETTTVGNIM